MTFPTDLIVFSPRDVDLTRSPLRRGFNRDSFFLGASASGLALGACGTLLSMVRIAEAPKQAIEGNFIHAIRWIGDHSYVADPYDLATVDVADPRKFRLRGHPSKVMALTSLSWLLPVELTPDGTSVVTVHYDKAIAPETPYQQYGVEDARISQIDGVYYMTTCSVSAERHSTTLYTSTDGLNYTLQGVILDHQNKDMLLFEGKVGGKFYALTRPLGDLYFSYPPDSPYEPGPSINLASSPDALHWRPVDTPLIRPRRGSASVMKVGGGSQPIPTPAGWLMLYHGVQPGTIVGVYRTYFALLALDDPGRILHIDDETPVLEARADLTEEMKDLMYLTDVVFTTGIVDADDHCIVASGEADLACRITHIPKHRFAI